MPMSAECSYHKAADCLRQFSERQQQQFAKMVEKL